MGSKRRTGKAGEMSKKESWKRASSGCGFMNFQNGWKYFFVEAYLVRIRLDGTCLSSSLPICKSGPCSFNHSKQSSFEPVGWASCHFTTSSMTFPIQGPSLRRPNAVLTSRPLDLHYRQGRSNNAVGQRTLSNGFESTSFWRPRSRIKVKNEL